MKVDLAPGAVAPGGVAALAAAAEAVGFDGLWLPETQHDPFIGLALAAAATSGLHLGTSVAIAFARSPTVLAQTAWDLAALSGGRFELGLGTQVRAHVQRRFGMAWSEPAPRLAEWLGAIRAAWATWQDRAPFQWTSEHLDLSLMTPFFSPPPLDYPAPDDGPRIPISVAGVGAGLARLAGRLADGFHVHPFHTARYLARVLEPALAAGAERRPAELPRRRVQRIVPVFLAPTDEPAVLAAVRQQVAFYASTPSYRAVLAAHDRERIGEQLSRLAATGRWAEMAALVDDELLAEVAVVAPSDGLADALAARVTGHAERVAPLLPVRLEADGSLADARSWRRLVATLRDA
jgi:probable F420-dependent oxidoreductase